MVSEIVDTFVAPVCHDEIDILFEDAHLLVINKPSGLLSLSGKNPLNLDSVHYRLVQHYPAAKLVHRLDFGTSGLMVVALSNAANEELAEQFRQRAVEKTYVAMLAGHLTSDNGSIDAPIAKDRAHFPRVKICVEQGKPALTRYQVLERLHRPDRTRVLFTPETGRTHQLRLHSLELGYPILGCDLYGTDVTRAQAPRLQLHATSLQFLHPETGTAMHITSDCPF